VGGSVAEKEDPQGITRWRLRVAGVAGLGPATTFISCTAGVVVCSRKESRAANPARRTARNPPSTTAVERPDERKPGGFLSYQEPLTPYCWRSWLQSVSLLA